MPKLRIDPAYLAGLIGLRQRPDVEHCHHAEPQGKCGKPTRHGKFFCSDHIMEMPYAGRVHQEVKNGRVQDEYEAA